MHSWVITQFGNSKIIVGGVKLLLDFFPNEISIRVHGGTVTVSGKNLMIERFDENEIVIIGSIDGVNNNVKN